jgi:hypothetical protein
MCIVQIAHIVYVQIHIQSSCVCWGWGLGSRDKNSEHPRHPNFGFYYHSQLKGTRDFGRNDCSQDWDRKTGSQHEPEIPCDSQKQGHALKIMRTCQKDTELNFRWFSLTKSGNKLNVKIK